MANKSLASFFGLFLLCCLSALAEETPLILGNPYLSADGEILLTAYDTKQGYGFRFDPETTETELLTILHLNFRDKTGDLGLLYYVVKGSSRGFTGILDPRPGGAFITVKEGEKPRFYRDKYSFPIRVMKPDRILVSRNEVEYRDANLLTDFYQWVGDCTGHYPSWKSKGILPSYLTIEDAQQRVYARFRVGDDGQKTMTSLLMSSEPFADGAHITVHSSTMFIGESSRGTKSLQQIVVLSLPDLQPLATRKIPGRCMGFELRNDNLTPMAIWYNPELDRLEWHLPTLIGSHLEFTLVGEEMGLYQKSASRPDLKAGGGTIAFALKDTDEIEVFFTYTSQKRVIPAHGVNRLRSVSADGMHLMGMLNERLYWFDLPENLLTIYRFAPDDTGGKIQIEMAERHLLP